MGPLYFLMETLEDLVLAPVGMRPIYKTSGFLCKKVPFLRFTSCKRPNNVGMCHNSTQFVYVGKRKDSHEVTLAGGCAEGGRVPPSESLGGLCVLYMTVVSLWRIF